MKKTPDIIHIDDPKENPLLKWINLSNWAIENNDQYLRERAYEMVLKLLTITR
jgi:hypothetical protein